jgi:hypothetical protein
VAICVQLVPSKLHVSFKYPVLPNPPNAIIFPLIGSYVIARYERAEGELLGESSIQSGKPDEAADALSPNAIEKQQQIRITDSGEK